MAPRVGRRFAWWTVPVGFLLWLVALWAAGLVQVWGAPRSAGYLRLRVMAGPTVLAGTLAAALALVMFAAHLRRARGSSD